jgi:imidazolonepropionase-like amidohydrolase
MDSERVLEGLTVIIEDGLISELGLSSTVKVPTEALVVDGEGKFLMPGLSDMHMHLFGSENDILLYLANGVTTVRDMGDGPTVQLEWRDQINRGTRTGPNIYQWSPMFEALGGLDTIISAIESPGGKVDASNPDGMDKLVAGFAAQGYDGIKEHVIFSSEVFSAVLNSAKNHGMLTDVHTPIDLIHSDDKASSWDSFRDLKIEAVSHLEELIKVVGTSDELISQAAHDAAEDGLWVTPTIGLMRSIENQIADLDAEMAKLPEAKYINSGTFKDRWSADTIRGTNRSRENWLKDRESDKSAWVTANEKMLLALNEAGVPLMSGTDAPLPLMVPGFSLHDELEYMVEIGLSPYDVLRTSTYNPALYLNKLNEFGTVEKGKRADLILLDANPLEDINNTRDISGVMVRGRWFNKADLDEMLELVADANK